MLFDAHLDLGYFVYWKKYLGEKDIINRYYYDDFIKGGLKLVIAAIYIDDIFLPDMGLKMALKELNALRAEIEEHSDKYFLVTSKEDLEEVVNGDRIGIVMSLEGLMPIENDLELLHIFHRLGVRGLGLAWSRRNYVVDGIGTFSSRDRGGLTLFGEKVVKFANENNMFIDVSHTNDQAVADVIMCTKKPIMASHSNPRKLNDIERNLSDDLIIKIAENDGFIGVNAFNKNMSNSDIDLDENRVVEHLEYFEKHSTIDNIGLGFDMIGKLEDIPQIERRVENVRKRYDVIENHSKIGELEQAMKDSGWNEEKIEKVMWKNLYDFLNKIL